MRRFTSCLLVLVIGSGCAVGPGDAAPVAPATGPAVTAGTDPGETPNSEEIGGTWELVSLTFEGESVRLDDWPGSRLPWVHFEPVLEGWTGCNSFYTYDRPEYTVVAGVLTFGAVVIETAGCAGRLRQVEEILIGFLWDDRGVAIGFDGDHMIWTRQDPGGEAVFAASD